MTSVRIPYVFRNVHTTRTLLTRLLGSADAADAVILALKLDAYYGSCFASATFLGFQVAQAREHRRTGWADIELSDADTARLRNNGKMFWRRLLVTLRQMGLVDTVRRIRPDGTQGTYRYDWTALWRFLDAALKAIGNARRWSVRAVTVVGGFATAAVRVAGIYHDVRTATGPPIF